MSAPTLQGIAVIQIATAREDLVQVMRSILAEDTNRASAELELIIRKLQAAQEHLS